MKKIDKKHLLGVLLVMILTAGISLEIGRVLPTIGALDTPASERYRTTISITRRMKQLHRIW